MLRTTALLLGLSALGGCSSPSPFRCDRAGASCAPPGACVAGFCAVPATECASGQRYTATAATPGACTAPTPTTDAAVDVAPVADAPIIDDVSDVPPAIDASDVPDLPDVPNVSFDLGVDAGADVPIVVDVPTDAPHAPSTAVSFLTPISSGGPAVAVTAVATGDVTGDGELDVALLRSDHAIEVYRGSGDGHFALLESIGVSGATALTIADVNNDVQGDLVILGTAVYVAFGQGTGLSSPRSIGAAGGGATVVRAGQMLGTSVRDIVVARPSANSVRIFVGPFDATPQVLDVGTANRPDDIALADLDRNGFDDVLTLDTTPATASVSYLRGSLAGIATTGTRVVMLGPAAAGAHPLSLVVGDYDDDGDREPAVVDESGFRPLDYSVDSNLVAGTRVGLGTGILAGASALLNADARSDLALIGEGDGLVHLIASPFDGTLRESLYAVPGSAVAVAAGDFTGDHVDDVLVYAGGLHLLAGRRDGTLAAPRAYRTCDSPSAVAVGSLRAIPTREVAVACGTAPTVEVRSLTPALDLSLYASLTTAFAADSLFLGRFNADGLNDVLASSGSMSRTQATFISLMNSSPGMAFASGTHVAVGDLDAVSRGLDLAVVAGARLWTSLNADGAFTASASVSSPGARFVDVAAVDFDADERREVLALDDMRDEVVASSVGSDGVPGADLRHYGVRADPESFLALPMTPGGGNDLVVRFGAGVDVDVLRLAGSVVATVGRADTNNSALLGLVGGTLTADACNDLATLHDSGGRIDVFPGDCRGGLATHVALPTFHATHFAIGDVNNDGRSDLMVLHDGGGARASYVSIWINSAR